MNVNKNDTRHSIEFEEDTYIFYVFNFDPRKAMMVSLKDLIETSTLERVSIYRNLSLHIHPFFASEDGCWGMVAEFILASHPNRMAGGIDFFWCENGMHHMAQNALGDSSGNHTRVYGNVVAVMPANLWPTDLVRYFQLVEDGDELLEEFVVDPFEAQCNKTEQHYNRQQYN